MAGPYLKIEDPDYGDGSDGDITHSVDITVDYQTKQHTSFSIATSVEYNVDDRRYIPHVIQCTEEFICNGTIDISALNNGGSGINGSGNGFFSGGGGSSAFEAGMERIGAHSRIGKAGQPFGHQIDFVLRNEFERLAKGGGFGGSAVSVSGQIRGRGGGTFAICTPEFTLGANGLIDLSGGNARIGYDDSNEFDVRTSRPGAGGGGTLYIVADKVNINGTINCGGGGTENTQGELIDSEPGSGGDGGLVVVYSISLNIDAAAVIPPHLKYIEVQNDVPLAGVIGD